MARCGLWERRQGVRCELPIRRGQNSAYSQPCRRRATGRSGGLPDEGTDVIMENHCPALSVKSVADEQSPGVFTDSERRGSC